MPLVTEYTGSALAGSLLAAAVHGLNGTGSIDPTVLLSGDIPAIVHQGCLVSSLVGISVKTIAKSGMNYARNQLIGSVVDKSTKKAFNWCSQKLTRQTINKVSKDTNKVAERILLKDGVSTAKKEIFSLDNLSKSGMLMDRGGLTRAGRALDKHGNRLNSVFPKATGNAVNKNMMGQFQLDNILTSPKSKMMVIRDELRIYAPDGRGVHFRKDGSMRGFLDYE